MTATATESAPDVARWTQEYKAGGIPSSTRQAPSGALLWALREIAKQGAVIGSAADIGCGQGRNSLHLASLGAQVTAMDFTPAAVERLRQAGGTIAAHVHDVVDPWPVAPASLDFASDTFCFKHLISAAARGLYRQHLLAALKPGGFYLVSFAGIDDGYYARFIQRRDTVRGAGEATITDPANGISSVLYTRERMLDIWRPDLKLAAEEHSTQPSTMHGIAYERSTHAMLFRRQA